MSMLNLRSYHQIKDMRSHGLFMSMSVEAAEARTVHYNVWNGANAMASNI
jgi:hypothetical protein